MISREETIKKLLEEHCGYGDGDCDRCKFKCEIYMAIEALQERPRGRWERISDRPKTYIRRCSVCNRDSYTCFSEKDYDFCPWCGAEMER